MSDKTVQRDLLKHAISPEAKAFASAVEELIESSKELIQNLEDAGQTHNDRENTDEDDGEEFHDVAAVRKALAAFGVDA